MAGIHRIFELHVFLRYRWRLPAGRTGQAKAKVNNNGLGQIRNSMNKVTIYRVMKIFLNRWKI